jgi:hypothetical protein
MLLRPLAAVKSGTGSRKNEILGQSRYGGVLEMLDVENNACKNEILLLF